MMVKRLLPLALLAGLLVQPLLLLGESLKCGPAGPHDHVLAAGADLDELAAHLRAEAACQAETPGATAQPARKAEPGQLVFSTFESTGAGTGVAGGYFLIAHLPSAPLPNSPADLWQAGAVQRWPARSLDLSPPSPPPWSPSPAA